jgi:hypothetical protein
MYRTSSIELPEGHEWLLAFDYWLLAFSHIDKGLDTLVDWGIWFSERRMTNSEQRRGEGGS